MEVVSMHQAKSTLSQLVTRAQQGEVIYIGAYGKVQAKIVAASQKEKQQKKTGVLAGKLKVPEDFDALLPDDVLDAFAG